MQDLETRKLTRARNVEFIEKNVVGFTSNLGEVENDLLFDVTIEDQNEAEDSQNVVQLDIKEEASKIETKPEELADEESSSTSETRNQIQLTRSVTMNPELDVSPENQVESTKNFILTPEIQASFFPARSSVGPFSPRPSRFFVLQEQPQKASAVQPTSQVVNSKIKPPIKLKPTGQYLNIGVPSSSRVYEGRREKYFEMKDAKKTKRGERSRNPPERYDRSYSHK